MKKASYFLPLVFFFKIFIFKLFFFNIISVFFRVFLDIHLQIKGYYGVWQFGSDGAIVRPLS